MKSFLVYLLMCEGLEAVHGSHVLRYVVMKFPKELDPERLELKKLHHLRRRTYSSLEPNWACHINR